MGRYEEIQAEHVWRVPERYNIAADCCDKHPRDKLAMVHERFDGHVRTLTWGELQDMSNRAANLLESYGVERGDRVAVVLPAMPEAAALFFGTWKVGAILLSMSVLYGDEGIAHRLNDSQPKVLVTDGANARAVCSRAVCLSLCSPLMHSRSTPPSMRPPTQLPTILRSCITRPARPALPRGSCTPTATCSRTKSSSIATRSRMASASTGWASGRGRPGSRRSSGPWRLGAVQCVYQREGGFDPHKQLAFLARHEVTNVFTTPTAMRSMMAVENAGDRYRCKFRRVCSAGEPLNPEAIRWFREQYGVTVLDYYGLTESYPLVANYPWMEVREGSMGRPMPGWDVQILDEDENELARGERGEICLRARSNPHYPLGYWRNEEAARETFGGEWFHTKDAAVMDEDGYIWYAGRADDVIISAGYRIGPFEVESVCIEHPAVREAAAVASPDERRGAVVKAFIVLAAGHEPSEELAAEISDFVRRRLSQYAYPRKVEFVDDLPKTLTGKIRRIELREREQQLAHVSPR